ncbi:hypothetical protein AB6A40_004152 [Gnathostoma spinigerum]|uniref:STAS domain-containing protein n=1 Tax=Gnathostoma spinigerum TaxID=75299 RepID=A0ABD6EKF2_9BILA
MQIFHHMKSEGVKLYFAGAKITIRDMFDACGFYESVPRDNFYPSIDDAVRAAFYSDSSRNLSKLNMKSDSVDQFDFHMHLLDPNESGEEYSNDFTVHSTLHSTIHSMTHPRKTDLEHDIEKNATYNDSITQFVDDASQQSTNRPS